MSEYEKHSDVKNKRHHIVRSFLYLLPAIFVLFLLFIFRERLTHIITPVIISLAFYFFLEPAVLTLEKKSGVKRTAAIFTVFACVAVLLVAIVVFITPIVKNNIKEIISNLPVLKDKVIGFGTGVANRLGFSMSSAPMEFLQDFISDKISDLTAYAESKVFSGSYINIVYAVFDFFSALVITFYLLRDREIIGEWILGLFPYSWREFLHTTVEETGKISSAFIRGQLIIATIVGTIEAIGLWIIGAEYPLVFGIIGGISNLIPYFGPFIGAVPAVISALFTSPIKAVWVALLFVLVQQIDNNFISPKIIEGRLGIHPITTIIVVFISGEFFGLPGILLGIPVYAIIKCIVKRASEAIARKNQEQDFA